MTWFIENDASDSCDLIRSHIFYPIALISFFLRSLDFTSVSPNALGRGGTSKRTLVPLRTECPS